MRQRKFKICVLICPMEARETQKMEWQDRSTQRAQGGNVGDWCEMYSSWIAHSWRDRCSESQSAHPSTPRSLYLTHYQASLPVNPQKACIITSSNNTTSFSCESAHAGCFQILSNSGKFKLHSHDVVPTNWCVIHHRRTPTCGHLLLLRVFSGGKWWELPEKHFRFY